MRRILAISSIGNQPHNLHGKYIPGSGVGASSVATRRLKTQKAAQCYPQPPVVDISLSDIATYNVVYARWEITSNTTITYLQHLVILSDQALYIYPGVTLTNKGFVDNYGFIGDSNSSNTTIININTFNNYGTIFIEITGKMYTYNGGSVYNDTTGTITNNGIFSVALSSGSSCGTGFFTGKPIGGTNPLVNQCPP
jgi:hypothetical protein